MSMLKKDGIYAGISTAGEPVTSKEVRKAPKVTNYRRMVCCLAISAGVAILVICFIAICATLFVEIARLKSEMSSSQEASTTHQTSESSMIMLQLQQINRNLSNIQVLMENENTHIEIRINQLNMSVDRLNQRQLQASSEVYKWPYSATQ
jgi:hypothetical protein